MAELVAEFSVPYFIMHMRGTPQTMMKNTHYDNLGMDIVQNLSTKINALRKIGIIDIVADPGIGFSKTVEQNIALLKSIDLLKTLDVPLLFGISRKSFLQKSFNCTAEDSLPISSVVHSHLIKKGVQILRVHDVKEAKQCVDFCRMMDF